MIVIWIDTEPNLIRSRTKAQQHMTSLSGLEIPQSKCEFGPKRVRIDDKDQIREKNII